MNNTGLRYKPLESILTSQGRMCRKMYLRVVSSSTVIVLNTECCSRCVTANPKRLQPPSAAGKGAALRRPPRRGRLRPGFALQFPSRHSQAVRVNTQGNPSAVSRPGSA